MVFNNSILLGASGQSTGQAPFDTTLIGNSIWLDGSADFLSRQNGSDFSNRKEVTLSFWVQRNKFASQQAIFAGVEGGQGFIVQFMSGDTFQLYLNGVANLTTNAVFRDIRWYHILVSIDTSQSISSERSKVYINGEQITSFSSAAYPSQDSNIPGISGQMTSSETMRIGNYNNSVSNFYFWKGYIAQACMIESKSIQQGDFAVSDFLDTFTFGTNGSQIIPKANADIAALATSAGGNSFCLDFANSSDLGNDISSNNNDFTPTSMSSDNQSGNTPSNSYPIWNPLEPTNSTLSFSEGNLRATGSGGSDGGAIGTIPLPTSGTSEFQIRANDGDGRVGIIALDGAVGVAAPSNNCAGGVGVGFNAAYHYSENGQVRKVISSGSSNISGFDSWSTNDVITVRYNADANELNFLRNNSAVGSTVSTEAGLVYYPVVCRFNDYDITAFFDSSKFPHTIGTGNLEVSSANQTAPDFQGIDYFDATLYEGNGGIQRVGDFVPFTDTYTVDKSAMFEYDDRRYLSFTPSSGGNQKTFTLSFWFKLTGLSDPNGVQAVISTDAGGKQFQIRFEGAGPSPQSQNLNINAYNGSSFVLNLDTVRKFAPSDGWTHAVFAVDTRTGVAAANKAKIYINGVQQTTTGTQLSTDDYDTTCNGNQEHNIGRQTNNAVGEPDIYFAEMVMVEDQQLDPTSFGQVDTSTNRWIPKDVSGLTFGDEGWYLEFDGTFNSGVAATGAGKDSSGNGNHWAEQNDSGSAWATTDQFTDTPSKNFCTWDHGRKGGHTLSQGNLTATGDAGADFDTVIGTMFVSSGKYYWEVNRDNDPAGSDRFRTGVALASFPPVISSDDRTDNWAISENGQLVGGGLNLTNYGDSTTTGDYIGVALDMDRNAIYFSKNGTWMNGASASGIADGSDLAKAAHKDIYGSVTPYISTYDTQVATLRTASGRWESTAPTGFLELNQDNLDDTASKITAWAWIKNRDAADNHMLFDRVRGVGKDLHSNSTAAEATNANTVQRFLQRGVEVGNDAEVNTVNESYVLWQWLLGDSATTGSTNSDGSVDTTVIAADAGHFSVVKGTTGSSGATFGHGLGAAPDLIINKDLNNSSSNWLVYNSISGASFYLVLNSSGSINGPGSTVFGTEPTSTVFTLGSFFANVECINYCFRSVPGVCKVGLYEGNSSSNGTYISMGFKPRWVMVKVIDSGTGSDGNWTQYDTARQPFNSTSSNPSLEADTSDTEKSNSHKIDILSDGIKFRDNSFQTNSARTYLYLAMADIGGNGTLPPIYGR